MHEIPVLITDLAILLTVAALTTLLCKKINLPSVLGYILAGFLAGPVVNFLPTIEDIEGIEVWSDIGVIFLMFGLGLEFSLHKLAQVGGPGFLSAGIQAAGMGGVGFLLGMSLGWGGMNSLFLGVMLAMSSTMITMKNVEDMGLKKAPFADLAMGTLVIEDILAIFAMVVLSTIAVSQSISGWALVQRLGLLCLYMALWLILGIYLVPTMMKKLRGLMNEETLLVFSLGLCFLMALLAEEIGLSTELGAFLAGSLLAGTIHAEEVEHLITPCKNLFGAVFFISVGFMVQPAMIWQYLWSILLLSAAAIVGKLLFLTAGALTAGKPLAQAVPAAAAQTQVGEFSFIIAGLGQSLGVTGVFLYPIIVAVSVVTTFTTPFVLKFSRPLVGWLENHLPKPWLAALDRWCQLRSRQKEPGDWARFLRGYFGSFFLYGILAFGAVLLGVRRLLPLMLETFPDQLWLARELTCLVIYLALALLLPAMLRVRRRFFTALWLEKVSSRVILSALMVLRLGAAVLLAVAPAVLIFQVSPLWISLVALPVVWLATHSKKLASHYLEVEARFLANFNERKLAARFGQGEGEEVHQWLTEQLHVITLAVPAHYAQDGRSLNDLNWGHRDHVQVIQVWRAGRHWNVPEGRWIVRGGDRLAVMGSPRQVENFCRQQAKDGLSQIGELMTLRDYVAAQETTKDRTGHLLCYGIQLEKNMPQVGKAVRESNIKGDWSAMLIGLERNLLPMPTPDPSLTLRAGDLLWVMGSREMAAKLLALGLLD